MKPQSSHGEQRAADGGAVRHKLGFKFIPIPVAIYRRKDLTPVDKMIVGRILSFGARTCFLAQGTFADELGVSRKLINERMGVLVKKYIIIATDRGRLGKFYAVVPDVTLGDISDRPDVTQKAPDVTVGHTRCNPVVTQVDVLVDSLEEQSSSVPVPEEIAQPKTDDDSLSLKTEPQNPNPGIVAECLLGAVKGWGIPLPKGNLPDQEITEILEKIGATVEDLAYFLKDDFRKKRGGNPATWKYLLVAVQHWAVDPKVIERLNLTRWAEAETRKAELAQVEREAKEAERRRLAHVAMTPEQAIELVEANPAAIGPFRGVPKILQKHLIRVEQEITPFTLAEMVRSGAYRTCECCEKTGLIGSSLERTRKFCDCLWGQELQHEDPERPAREIEQAHASVKGRLIAVAHSIGEMYVADALEASAVTEMESELIFDPPKSYRLYFKDKGFAEVMKAAGEQRTVRLVAA